MPKRELTIKSYPVLLSQLKTVFIQGLQRIEEEKVKTYWRTGQLISDYILENKERAEYGDNLFERLSEDLDIEESTLQRSVRFYRAYPNLSNSDKFVRIGLEPFSLSFDSPRQVNRGRFKNGQET